MGPTDADGPQSGAKNLGSLETGRLLKASSLWHAATPTEQRRIIVPELPSAKRTKGGPTFSEFSVHAAAGRGSEHTAALRIHLLIAILGELNPVPVVECRSRMPGDINRT